MATKKIDPTKKALMDRRDALQAEIDKVDAQMAPARAKRDEAIARSQAIDEEIAEFTAEIKPFEAEKFALQNELGTVARALGGYSTSTSETAPTE